VGNGLNGGLRIPKKLLQEKDSPPFYASGSLSNSGPSEGAMKPPLGIVLTAGILALLCLFLPLLGAVPVCTPPPSVVFTSYALGFLVIGAPILATAVGLLRLRRWARNSTLALSVLVATIGLLFVFISYTSEARQAAEIIENREVMLFGLALAAAGVLEIYYLSRGAIKQRFGYATRLVNQGSDAGNPAVVPARQGISAGMSAVAAVCLAVLVVGFMFSVGPAPSHPCGVPASENRITK
jgi:hypothetical protein